MNNEFVMVPRQACERIVKDGCASVAIIDQIEKALAKPAAQHQGEPVGKVLDSLGTIQWSSKSPPSGTKLYIRADTGEVERLNDHLDAANRAIEHAATTKEAQQKTIGALMADVKQFRSERDTLRAQLAERNALLRLAKQFVVNGVELGYIRMPDADTPDPAHDLLPKINAALSASAEQSAPKVITVVSDDISVGADNYGIGLGPTVDGLIAQHYLSPAEGGMHPTREGHLRLQDTVAKALICDTCHGASMIECLNGEASGPCPKCRQSPVRQWAAILRGHKQSATEEVVCRGDKALGTACGKCSRCKIAPKCDGNHGGPRCADPECWNDSPVERDERAEFAKWTHAVVAETNGHKIQRRDTLTHEEERLSFEAWQARAALERKS